MARKKQEGNRFFRMDADFFSDRKIKILKARYGADGIVLYLYLLCEIYKTGYYLQVDDDFEYIISDDLLHLVAIHVQVIRDDILSRMT